MQISGRPLPEPRGSKYPILKASGSKNHILNGFRDQKPQILGTWTLWGRKLADKYLQVWHLGISGLGSPPLTAFGRSEKPRVGQRPARPPNPRAQSPTPRRNPQTPVHTATPIPQPAQRCDPRTSSAWKFVALCVEQNSTERNRTEPELRRTDRNRTDQYRTNQNKTEQNRIEEKRRSTCHKHMRSWGNHAPSMAAVTFSPHCRQNAGVPRLAMPGVPSLPKQAVDYLGQAPRWVGHREHIDSTNHGFWAPPCPAQPEYKILLSVYVVFGPLRGSSPFWTLLPSQILYLLCCWSRIPEALALMQHHRETVRYSGLRETWLGMLLRSRPLPHES